MPSTTSPVSALQERLGANWPNILKTAASEDRIETEMQQALEALPLGIEELVRR
jgi:hypothetical protein